MKKKYTNIVSKIVAIPILLFIIMGSWHYWNHQKTIVLEFGMFTGSNWDVENADAFVIIDRVIERFERKHPKVKVKYISGIDKKDYSEWCAKRMLLGKLPDVFMVLDNDFNQYCTLGVLEKLNSYMREDRDFHENELFYTALSSGRGIGEEDVQYGLPYEVVPTLLFVNKTLLKKEGIQVPKKDWTWEDFFEICKKITKDTDQDGRVDQFGTYDYTWLHALYTSGGKFFDDKKEKLEFTNSKVIEAIKFMKSLNELNQGENVTKEDFLAGKVAFMPLTFAEYRTYKTYPYKIKKYTNFQWDCTTFPASKRGNNVSKVDTLLLSISRSSKHKKLAWELLKEFVYNEESQTDIFRFSQGVPVKKSVAGSSNALSIIQREMDKGEQVISGELLCNVIENGVIVPKFHQYEQIVGLANTEIGEIFDKDKDVESSIKIFQRKINQYLNK